MASFTPISQSQSLFNNTHLKKLPPHSLAGPNLGSEFLPKWFSVRFQAPRGIPGLPMKASKVVVSATTAEKPKKRYPGEAKGFVEEMRFVAMKLHTRDQAKEGEKEVKEPEERPVAKWEPSIEGYLRFLVDSKLVYDTLEEIVEKAPIPSCEYFFFFLFEKMESFNILGLFSCGVRFCEWV